MRVHILAKTEFSSKQRKKWMSGIQMNVEDAVENGMDFYFYFLWLIFFIRSQDLHYCFCANCISLSAPGRELDKDLQMISLSMHHLGELPLQEAYLVHMHHIRNIYENSLMLSSCSLQKRIRNKSVKITYFSTYGSFGESRLPMKRTIFFFAVLEPSGPCWLGSKHVLHPTAGTCVHINSVWVSNSHLLMN